MNRALYKNQHVWFFGALTLLLSMVALYIYFMSASVVHVVMRKELNQQIAEASSRVSQLESQYIEVQHSVSADIATLAGFHETDEKVFIDRTDTTLVLSERNGG